MTADASYYVQIHIITNDHGTQFKSNNTKHTTHITMS